MDPLLYYIPKGTVLKLNLSKYSQKPTIAFLIILCDLYEHCSNHLEALEVAADFCIQELWLQFHKKLLVGECFNICNYNASH